MQKESHNIQKIELRKAFLIVRKGIPEQRRKQAAITLTETIQDRGHTLSFFPMGSEIDLSSLNLILAKSGRLFLNRLEEARLVPYRVTRLDQLQLSSLGIPEPDPNFCTKAMSSEIDLILVPGLSFDREGYRLGYGKGYYDILLSSLINITSIGIGFHEQLASKSLPRDSWDIPVKELLLI